MSPGVPSVALQQALRGRWVFSRRGGAGAVGRAPAPSAPLGRRVGRLRRGETAPVQAAGALASGGVLPRVFDVSPVLVN